MKFKIISFNYIHNFISLWNSNIFFNEILIKYFFYKTALCLAVEKENIEIVKLLLMNDKLDINLGYILFRFFIEFNIISFNRI